MVASRSRGDVREALQRFLFEHVESHEELNVVVLLRRGRERDWSPAEAAAELRLSASSCLLALEMLEQRGLVTKGAFTNTFRYSPDWLEQAARLAQLDECYRTHRLTIVMLMSVNAIERLRIATIHRFADTLRLHHRNHGARTELSHRVPVGGSS